MIVSPVKGDAMISEDDLSLREIPIAYVDDRVVRASAKHKALGVRSASGRLPLWCVAVLVIAAAPSVVLERKTRKRIAELDAQAPPAAPDIRAAHRVLAAKIRTAR
ncbi:hypothetical protein BH11MYX4_BH11MYX4_38300 [soil metagenome]